MEYQFTQNQEKRSTGRAKRMLQTFPEMKLLGLPSHVGVPTFKYLFTNSCPRKPSCMALG